MPKKEDALSHGTEFKAVIRVLKEVLKERQISYKDLAARLGMSESGVKKIFTGKDCSFLKLMQISKILKLKFSDLMNEIEHEEMRPVHFNQKQQEVFLKDRSLFYFYVKLVIERMSVEEIQIESRLTDTQCFKYLKSLDDIGIIKLQAEGKVKLPSIALVSQFGQGPLLEKTYQHWGQNTVKLMAHPKNQASGKFIIRCLRMKSETYQDFLNQLQDLEKQIAKRALREMAVSTKNLITTRWISMTDTSSFVPGPIHNLD